VREREATELQAGALVEKERRRVRVGGFGGGMVVYGTVEAASRLSRPSGRGALHFCGAARNGAEQDDCSYGGDAEV